MLRYKNAGDVVEVDRLQLAAWLQLNRQKLLERRLQSDGRVIYSFERSEEIDGFIKQWEDKTVRETTLARFSRIVSAEIQWAVRTRRAAGLPTRIRSTENS